MLGKEAHHLDLDDSMVAVFKEVLNLSVVDPHHTQQQLTREPECERSLRVDDRVCA